MALYYNSNNVQQSNNVYYNSNASNKVYHNNNLVWQKQFLGALERLSQQLRI